MAFPGVLKLLEKTQVRVLGPALRWMGRRLIASGNRMAGDTIGHYHLQTNPNNLAVKNVHPKISESAFVGRNSVVSGNVEIAPKSVVFFNNTFKAVGEGSRVFVDTEAYIMDHVKVTADGGKQVYIGPKALISPHAVLRNCHVGKGGFVGARATVESGASISESAVLAAGAVLKSGDVIPPRQVWAGIPATYLREVTEEEVEYLKDLEENYSKTRDIYKIETEKSGATYNMDPEVIPEGESVDYTPVVSDEWFQETMESINYSVAIHETQARSLRADKFKDLDDLNFKQQDILYDGNQPVSPPYLGEFQRTNQVENELKRNLEYDPERMRMRKEELEAKRQQVDDTEFKRKF